MTRPTTTRRERWLLALLLLLTAAGRAAVATSHPTSLVAGEIYKDDAFYYFEIARNVADGRGFTVDGVAPTNGFQPLQLLTLVPLFVLSGGERTLPLHLAGLVAALVSAGTGLLLYRTARALAGTVAALLVLGLWCVSPYFIAHDVNGQETALALCFSIGLVRLHVAALRASARPSWSWDVGYGVVAGLAVLARLDAVVLLVVLGAHRLWWRARTDGVTPALRNLATAAIVAALLWLPWAGFIRSRTGDAIPQSGKASRIIALDLGWSNLRRVWFPPPEAVAARRDPATVYFDRDDVPATYYLDVATKLAFVSALEFPPLAPLRGLAAFDPHPKLGRYGPYRIFVRAPLTGTLGAIALVAALAWWVRRSASWHASRPGIGAAVGLHALLMAAVYTVHCPAHWNFNRYMIVPLLLGTLQVVVGGSTLLRRVAAPPWRGRIGWTCAIVLLACQIHQLRYFGRLSYAEVEPAGFLRSWETIRPHVADARTIGAFQSGVIGYFSERDVVNLDGKVNRDALHALERRRVHEYVRERGLDYLMDWDRVIYALYVRHAPREARRLQPVPLREPSAGVRLFRIREGPTRGSSR